MNELSEYVLTHVNEINSLFRQQPAWIHAVLQETRQQNIDTKDIPTIQLSAEKKYVALAARRIVPDGVAFAWESPKNIVFHPQTMIDVIMMGMIIHELPTDTDETVFTTMSVFGTGVLGFVLGLELNEHEHKLMNNMADNFRTKSQ